MNIAMAPPIPNATITTRNPPAIPLPSVTFPTALAMDAYKSRAPNKISPIGETRARAVAVLIRGSSEVTFVGRHDGELAGVALRSPLRCLKAFTHSAFPTREAGDGGTF